jgi:nucleotide-binding universal stress UspA family protein
MSKIVACIDNSAAAHPVLAAALAIAPVLGASVEALNVVEDSDQTARAAAQDMGTPLRTVHGDPLEQITIASAAPDVVAVVIGVRALPTGGRTGHVALAVANRVDTPVLVVPPDAQPPTLVRRVLIAMEGTQTNARNLKHAIELAANAALDIIVVHVDDEDSIPSFTDQACYETEAYTKEFLARYLPGAPTARLELRIGTPVDEILSAAQDVAADLLAIGWRQSDDPSRGPVAHALVNRSHLPVFLVALQP